MYRKDMTPEIVDSFIQEFNLNGPKLTLDDVSARIHISKKTIYRFFASKNAIYEYIIDAVVSMIREHRKAIFDDASLSTKEKFYAVLAYRTPWEEKIDLSKIPSIKYDSPEVFAKILGAFQDSFVCIAELIEQGKKEGTFKPDLNSGFTLRLLRAAKMSLLQTDTLKESGLTYPEATCRLAEFALAGVTNNAA